MCLCFMSPNTAAMMVQDTTHDLIIIKPQINLNANHHTRCLLNVYFKLNSKLQGDSIGSKYMMRSPGLYYKQFNLCINFNKMKNVLRTNDLKTEAFCDFSTIGIIL